MPLKKYIAEIRGQISDATFETCFVFDTFAKAEAFRDKMQQIDPEKKFRLKECEEDNQ